MNDTNEPLASNRDRHANVGEGVLGEKLTVFLGHPLLQGLPAVLETPGKDGHGPDADDVARSRRCRHGQSTVRPAQSAGIRAMTRNEGAPSGSSQNSGFTHPSSPARLS